MVTQHAQDHATLRPFNALLQGSVAPAFMKFPVLKEHLDQPPQRVKPGNIIMTPGNIRGGQIAIVVLSLVFQSNNKSLLPMGFDLETGRQYRHLLLLSSSYDQRFFNARPEITVKIGLQINFFVFVDCFCRLFL